MINKKNIKNGIIKLKDTGFFSIFLSTVLSKVITLLGGVILVRVLSKAEYGTYAYIHNCFSMLFLLNDFGISTAALQYLTENINNKEKQLEFLKYSVKACFITSIAIGAIVLLSPYFYPYTMEEARIMTPMLFLVPIITIFSGLASIILRANFENKKYSKLQIFTTIITYIVLIITSLIWGLKGAILSQYIDGFIILVYSVYLVYKYVEKLKNKEIKKITGIEKKGFIKYAFASQLNNTIGSLMLIIDTFLIGVLISNSETIATYNVGSKLPQALTFLSTCIAIYITPHFVRHNKDAKWLNKNFRLLIIVSIVAFSILCLCLIIGAKLIFSILFGQEYYDAIPIYIVLMIGLLFTSALKVPCANILSSLRKIKINIITNIICIVINFISNIFFIKKLGIIGAAITTTSTNIIISFIYVIYLRRQIKKMEVNLNDTK